MKQKRTLIVMILIGACLVSLRCKKQGPPPKSETPPTTESPTSILWGSPLQGVSLSARSQQNSYKLGQDIEIRVYVRNLGDETALLLTEGTFLYNFRLALFGTDGKPVPKPDSVVELEAALAQQEMLRTRRSVKRIAPGETKAGYEIISLNEWFTIDKEGSYFLVVMRRLWSWEKGFLISNVVNIKITKD